MCGKGVQEEWGALQCLSRLTLLTLSHNQLTQVCGGGEGVFN